MAVFLDPQNDYAFRRTFGNENKLNILLSFLNSTLGFSGEQRIDKVTILNPFQVPHIKRTKETIVDVRCRDHGGHEYIVEMQVLPKDHFDKRILYYASKSYSLQLERGGSYASLRRVIFVGVLGFSFSTGEDYMAKHEIRNIQSNEQILRDFEFTFVELPKFNKKENELKTLADKWIYFLRYAPDLKEIPKVLADDADIVAAFEIIRECNWSKEEMMIYDEMGKRRMDAFAEIEYGRKKGEAEGEKIGIEKGIEKGVAIGIEQGIEKGKIEVAQNLLAQSIGLKVIAEVTGLSCESLRTLQSQSKGDHY